MLYVRRGYRIAAARHFVYVFIILFEFFMMDNGMLTSTEINSTTFIVVQWLMLMPAIVISRYMIFRGFYIFRKHKSTQHHHHHHDDDVEVPMITPMT